MLRSRMIYVILFVALIGIAALLAQSLLGNKEELALETPDYTQESGWAFQPEMMPEPVWVTGWTTDVILILDSATLTATSDKQLVSKTEEAQLQAGVLADDFESVGAVFVPLVRQSNRNEDISNALMHYLETNQGRAFFIATDSNIEPEALSPIEVFSAKDRFGGFLLLEDIQVVPALCPVWINDCSTRIATLGEKKLVRLDPSSDISTNAFVTNFQKWLQDTLSPMAEPLGDLEEIEIIDIRRPGDTDEARMKAGD